MLCKPGGLPGFRMFRGERRRNPLVPLPEHYNQWLDQVDACLLTHQHPDHLDLKAKRWIKQHNIPLLIHPQDYKKLRKEGLPVELHTDHNFGIQIKPVRAQHGPGLIGWLMGKGTGWLIKADNHPSLYITGDTIYTPELEQVLAHEKPQVVIAPAGAANFGLGPDILFPFPQLIQLANQVSGALIFNHLEALDHCLITRGQLREALPTSQYPNVYIPQDGELIEI